MFVYLASPYSHDFKEIREVRYRLVLQALLEISRLEIPVYSPIVHWHPLAVAAKLPTTFEFWSTQNDPMVKSSKELWILCLDGWRQSRGIEHEMKLAYSSGLRVRYLNAGRTAEYDNLPELKTLFFATNR